MLREETAAITPHFDAVDYLFYIRRRWRVIAAACAIAGVVAFVGSLLLPKRYTSTASILIEAPAGTDPRAFTAVSPVYLESLKTYERVALSDSLFQRAMQHFNLASQSVEGMKRRVLKVTKVRDIRILDISVTLENPKQAQAIAQFLADETVKLSSTAPREAGRDLMDETRRQLEEARAKLDQARAAWAKQITNEPVETLKLEIASLLEFEQRLRRSVAEANAAAAAYEVREKLAGAESASRRARAERLQQELETLEQNVRAKDRLIAKRAATENVLESQLKIAQNRFDAATKLYENLESSVGFSGERLKVIDPGIVPQRPSEPKKTLNVVIAVSLAFLGSMLYLTLSYNIHR